MIKLVVALGNPEEIYAATRHNIAWQLIEYLSFFERMIWQYKFSGQYTTEIIEEKKIFFLKPETYMNKSGDSVIKLINFFKIEFEEILIIHDDIELDFGVVSFKRGGGLAGHNGLRSVAASLGTRNFKRLRLGISRPSNLDVTSYVLDEFSEEEKEVIHMFLAESARLLENCLENDFAHFEKNFRKKNILNCI